VLVARLYPLLGQNFMILVRVLDLKFLFGLAAKFDRNFKSTALAQVNAAGAPRLDSLVLLVAIDEAVTSAIQRRPIRQQPPRKRPDGDPDGGRGTASTEISSHRLGPPPTTYWQ
jgi:hypothetical protein